MEQKLIEAFADKLYAINPAISKEDLIKALPDDIQHIIEQADINAEYGYKPAFLTKSNPTAMRYVELYGDTGRKFIIRTGCLGYAQCAEDDDCYNDMYSRLENYIYNDIF